MRCSLYLCRYKVTVHTSDIRGAGTDADVFCAIYGERGTTGERVLDTSANNFERGMASPPTLACMECFCFLDVLWLMHESRSTMTLTAFSLLQEDTFIIECEPLGALKRLRIWHNNKGFGSAWHLKQARI